MVIGRVVAPTAVSSGVSFATVRDYLVSIPGIPSHVAEQLRTFSGDGSTLPLPIPTERITAEQTDVNGVSATLLATLDGAFTAVVWVEGGVLNVVAGSLDDDEVLSIASQVQ